MSASFVSDSRHHDRTRGATLAGGLILLLLALAPLYAAWANDGFLLTLLTRIMLFGMAAVSLNLILGYGGMVSFGHALYLGLGVYAAIIPAHYGIDNGWIQLALALSSCAVVAALTGSMALRTSGIAFIMITLAFAQMFFFLFVSLSEFGGDDGLRLAAPSRMAGLNLTDPLTLYGVSFGLLCLVLFLCHRLIKSRFGMVLQGAKANDRRMKALGFPTFRYRLTAYVLSAMVCGMAGFLYANLTQFGAPAYMSWTLSGELIVMVVLGGMGTLFGPLLGAMGMILTEEWLKALTEHWMILFGPLIVIIISISRLGLAGLLNRLVRPGEQPGQTDHKGPSS